MLSAALLLVVSPRARAVLRDEPQHPVVLWTLLGAFTVWLSFGPIVHIGGRTARTWPSLYAAVYHVVPGADALRVPPRIAMVTALALSVIGGLAVASLSRRRGGPLASGVLAVVFVAESWPAPVPVRRVYEASYGHGRAEPVPPRPSDHPLARAIAALPADAVLVDLPFGAVPDELWWQYLSIGHWRRRLNGYSGDVPPGHLALQQTLADLPAALDGGAAADTLPDAAMQRHPYPRRHPRRCSTRTPGRRPRRPTPCAAGSATTAPHASPRSAPPKSGDSDADRQLDRCAPLCRPPSSLSSLLLVLAPSSVLLLVLRPPSSVLPVCLHGTLMAHVRVR